jgi:hypothetical protein
MPNETAVLQNLDPCINCNPKTKVIKNYEKPIFTYEAKTPKPQLKKADRVLNSDGSVKNGEGSCSRKASNRLRAGGDSTKAYHTRPQKETFDVILAVSIGLLQRIQAIQ